MLNKAEKIFGEIMGAIEPRTIVMENKNSSLVNKVCCGNEKGISYDEKNDKEFFLRDEGLIIRTMDNIYQCISCGSRGTIIEWYSKAHNCSFSDSILFFNDYFNLNLLDDVDESDMAILMELVKFYNDEYIRYSVIGDKY